MESASRWTSWGSRDVVDEMKPPALTPGAGERFADAESAKEFYPGCGLGLVAVVGWRIEVEITVAESGSGARQRLGRGVQAEVADLVETSGEHVLYESTNELVGG